MNDVRQYINEAQKRFWQEHGTYIPAPRRSFTFEDAGVRVTLHGDSLGSGPVANYSGPLGNWQARFTLRGCGKPYQV